MDKTLVVLVDKNDNQIGAMEKMEAHKKALLHRAISVFICNSKGEWLLQRRSLNKYHSNGLWTNSCCSHPFPGETAFEAANRRLVEEMGIKCELEELFSFTYIETLDNDLTEHEFDHVFFGETDELPSHNSDEVLEWKYIDYNKMVDDIHQNPDKYTVWFKKLFKRVNHHLLTINSETK